ncbi:IclR family transcriptional regulator [Streptomyces sp. NPDC092296]|uniref:IclR family transcriptional regulator n=1 Tax=Streptomyces sp. NPDC092296 TaxID=3366012 RepID=UPI003806C40E
MDGSPATPDQRPSGAQAVHRALGVLGCFRDEGPELSASHLARRLRLSVSTTHRLARTLVSAGFLEQDRRTSRYRLGPAVTELGRLSYYQRGLHLADPELEMLARRTSTTADLAIRSGRHAVIMAGGSAPADSSAGLARPLHSTALGKVLLAWARPGEDDLAALGPLEAHTGRTIVDPAALRAELARVRADGYALNDGESAAGVRTLAVPILDVSGYAHSALALRSTPSVLTDERIPWFLAMAQNAAAGLEVLLLPPELRRPPLLPPPPG